jgi:hypothetical protein
MSLKGESDPDPWVDGRFDAAEDHIFASLDRFERDILRAWENQVRTFTFCTVVAIVGTNLVAALILIAFLP